MLKKAVFYQVLKQIKVKISNKINMQIKVAFSSKIHFLNLHQIIDFSKLDKINKIVETPLQKIILLENFKIKIFLLNIETQINKEIRQDFNCFHLKLISQESLNFLHKSKLNKKLNLININLRLKFQGNKDNHMVLTRVHFSFNNSHFKINCLNSRFNNHKILINTRKALKKKLQKNKEFKVHKCSFQMKNNFNYQINNIINPLKFNSN